MDSVRDSRSPEREYKESNQEFRSPRFDPRHPIKAYIMPFTNIYQLPAEVGSAVVRDPYFHDGRISVTSLIGPPRIYQLRKRHADAIVEDVSERLFALYGQVAHGILERADDFEAIHEEQLKVEIGGWIVSGQSDLYMRLSAGGFVLRHYKFPSVYTANFGIKPEWSAQLNCYAHLWRAHGFEVDRAQIVSLYRDWYRMEAQRRRVYPPPVQLFDVALWTHDETQRYLEERVALHQQAEALPDDKLPPCSPEERWERCEAWAVMKKARKTAIRVYDNPVAAQHHAMTIQGAYIEHRPPQPVRCLHFCNVRDFCNCFQEGVR